MARERHPDLIIDSGRAPARPARINVCAPKVAEDGRTSWKKTPSVWASERSSRPAEAEASPREAGPAYRHEGNDPLDLKVRFPPSENGHSLKSRGYQKWRGASSD